MSAVATLQTLLERVQRRAVEPRGNRPLEVVNPPSVALTTAVGLQPVTNEPFSSSPIPMARRDRTITRQLQRVRPDSAQSLGQPPFDQLQELEEVEEYEEELIELIDETETRAAPEVAPVSSALQLDDPLENLSEPPVSDQPIAGMTPVTAASLNAALLTAEVVARPAVPPVAVGHSVGSRPALETTSFGELLAISLRLGS